MCQCHTMWQSEGALQVQVAQSKKIPPGEKKILHGVPDFFSGATPEGEGVGKKSRANFFPPPPLWHSCSANGTHIAGLISKVPVKISSELPQHGRLGSPWNIPTDIGCVLGPDLAAKTS